MDSQAPVLRHLAANLRRLRQAAGLSQEALAKVSGVSRRMLVAIEAGESNVSLSTLDRIAEALGVLLPALIVDTEEASPVLAWQGQRAESRAHLLQSVPARRQAELWLWELAPGDTYESPADPGDWHEMVYVVEGRLTLVFPDRRLHLEAGQSAAYPSTRPVVFENAGDGPLRLLRNVVI
ncbi:helix-turn-helix domain-containing protein [Zavarzinia sp.]|uniref:helix-turn-helix domain-containing protein n=1 Tax=Zavarzinia sp. TaxID=2027920 RepID=UPI003568A841